MVSKKLYYQGVRFAPYDLVREFLVAIVVVSALVLVLAAVLSSPDVPPLTLKTVALQTPQNFLQTELDSLDGNSPVSAYGPPYNHQSGSVQHIGPISLQETIGVHLPVNPAEDFALKPLTATAGNDSLLRRSLHQFTSATASDQAAWESAYGAALAKSRTRGASVTIPSCACGPLTVMMSRLLGLGQSGAMDGLLLTSGHFYETDYTRPLLFMNYTDAMTNTATRYNLLGSTWGVMNETGNYPGQAWLWLYTFFYQIPPYTTAWAANTDALAVLSVTILSMLLLLLPWIPGLNRIPRILPVYKLIWRDYYRETSE